MCFDVSIPIRLICSTDGSLYLRSATTSVWHTRCRRGPSTPTDADLMTIADGSDLHCCRALGGVASENTIREAAMMPDEFLGRVRTLLPALRERALQAERLRRL